MEYDIAPVEEEDSILSSIQSSQEKRDNSDVAASE
jgi:hypothetical protein